MSRDPNLLQRIALAGGDAELRAMWSSFKVSSAVLIALALEHYFDAIVAFFKGAFA